MYVACETRDAKRSAKKKERKASTLVRVLASPLFLLRECARESKSGECASSDKCSKRVSSVFENFAVVSVPWPAPFALALARRAKVAGRAWEHCAAAGGNQIIPYVGRVSTDRSMEAALLDTTPI